MRCQECGREATGNAAGWEAHVVDVDDDGQNDLVFYCRVCAEREFHCIDPAADEQSRDDVGPA